MATEQTPRRDTGGQTGAGNGTSGTTVPPRRFKFLHPTHLTGWRRPAEPGSDYCARHGGP
jgi:hypothetical protein